MSAEWCEKEPIVRYMTRDGASVAAHVYVDVPDTKEGRSAYDAWHHERAVVAGAGAIVVTGPACVFRVHAAIHHPPPKQVYGDPDAEYQGGETVTIPIDR